MSTYPQPPVRLRRALAPGAPTDARRPAATRRLRNGLGLLGVAHCLLVGPAALAEPPADLDLEPPTAVESDAEAEQFGEKLADWFARFDARIRTLSVATDRAASRALEGGLGALADGHDRRMTDRAQEALADAPDAARRHYSLAAVGAGPGGSTHESVTRAQRNEPARAHGSAGRTALPAAPAPR